MTRLFGSGSDGTITVITVISQARNRTCRTTLSGHPRKQVSSMVSPALLRMRRVTASRRLWVSSTTRNPIPSQEVKDHGENMAQRPLSTTGSRRLRTKNLSNSSTAELTRRTPRQARLVEPKPSSTAAEMMMPASSSTSRTGC